MTTIYTTSPAKVALRGLTAGFYGRADYEETVMTSPDNLLASVTALYAGKTRPEVSPEEMADFVEDIKRTRLKAPLRFINTVWLIQDVTRAFTHQIVRYSVGTAFVQESLRFVAKRELRVFLNGATMDSVDLLAFKQALDRVEEVYGEAIRNDVPIQDARSILPTNTLTNIWASISLEALAGIYNQRMCCQAQEGEWNVVLGQMKSQLEETDPMLASFLRAPTPGHCGFGASFDRPCTLTLNGDQTQG